MKIQQLCAIGLFFFGSLCSDPDYSHFLEAPYPPPPLNDSFFVEDTSLGDTFHSIDDVANFELGATGSLQRDRQEYHRRLLSAVDSSDGYYSFHEIEGYLVPFSKNEKLTNSVRTRIKTVFDQSMRRIYYAGYGCETLEQALYDHEELQSSISKYYPHGIPVELSRLSQYFKAMAYGYRPKYLDKIEQLRAEKLTILEVTPNEETEFLKPGINPLRIVLDKESLKPLAIWKAGSDKYYGKFLLMGYGENEKVYDLESAKIEMGFISTWHELLGQALNYLYRGKFLTPTVARFGDTTLHAYHKNEGSLSQLMRTKGDDFIPFVESLEKDSVQYWGMMQFLMSSSDSHRGNTLIDGNYFILIDFGRALGIPHPMAQFQMRTSALDFPQMSLPFSKPVKQEFGLDLTDRLYEFVEGIEKYEPRKIVQKEILKSIDHLQKNLITLRLAVKRDLTPYQIFRLKYPPIGLEDHLTLETLFTSLYNKDPYGEDAKDREFRYTLGKSEIFKKAPFMKAYVIGEHDNELFEYLMERELNTIQNTPVEELFSEYQLSWLIKASIIIPIKLKPFF